MIVLHFRMQGGRYCWGYKWQVSCVYIWVCKMKVFSSIPLERDEVRTYAWTKRSGVVMQLFDFSSANKCAYTQPHHNMAHMLNLVNTCNHTNIIQCGQDVAQSSHRNPPNNNPQQVPLQTTCYCLKSKCHITLPPICLMATTISNSTFVSPLL